MADILDQSEVDALLAAVDSGSIEETRNEARVFSRHRSADDQVEVNEYDFKRPERVSKDQMRALQTLHEGFARNFGASLSGFLRTIVEVKVATCEQMTYSEFINGLPNPTSFNLVGADSLEGQMCLEVSPLIVYPIIDRLLGGTSTDLFIPQRPMTTIESRLIGNVITRALSALSEAWSSLRQMTFDVQGNESNPQLVQIVPPNEVVVVVGFELKMSNRAGTMNLCIPYNVIEPIVDELTAQSWFSVAKNQKSDKVEAQIKGQLSRAAMEVSGLLAETTITMRDLLEMAPGDLIVTEKQANSPLTLCVEGEKKYLCFLGQFKGKKALRVMRAIGVGDRV